MHKSSKKQKILKKLKKTSNPFFLAFLVWIFAGLWIVGSEFGPTLINHDSASRNRLSLLQNTIYSFQFSKRMLPGHLLDLRFFAKAHGLYFTKTDSLHQNISYFPFSKNYFFLKSYGADGEENRLNSESDILRSNLPKISDAELYPARIPLDMPTRFPFSVLEGVDSKDKDLNARLFVNATSGKRYLVVRKRSDDSFLMISSHDRVEEFFWLPGDKSIIFTASGSNSYLDGIYLWDLEKNETQNIAFDLFKDDYLQLKGKSLRIESTLAGIVENTDQILLFARKIPRNGLRSEDGSLYQTKYLFFLSSEKDRKFELADTHKKVRLNRIFESIPENQLVTMQGEARGVLKELFSTPFEGHTDEVVGKWQELVEHFGNETSLTPHLMWTIACLYMNAHDAFRQTSASDAKIANAYAIEILKGLIDLSYAPGYLKTEAGLAIHRLDENKANPFHYGVFR